MSTPARGLMGEPVRAPTHATPAERWAWWETAITGAEPPVWDGEPQAGFYKVRKWSAGPFAPARIVWLTPEIDADTRELITDERVLADIDGHDVDPWEAWTWIARYPITEADWHWLRAISPLWPIASPTGLRPWWEFQRHPPL